MGYLVVMGDYEKQAIKTYQNDIEGFAEGAKTKAKNQYLTVNNKPTKIVPWKDEVRKARMDQASKLYKRVSAFRIAALAALIASIVLMAVAVCGAPVLAGAATIIGITAGVVGVSCVGLFIAALVYNQKFRKIALKDGQQYAYYAQNIVSYTLDRSWRAEDQRRYAGYVSKQFGKSTYEERQKTLDACFAFRQKIKTSNTPDG